jgi:hypothetical protein
MLAHQAAGEARVPVDEMRVPFLVPEDDVCQHQPRCPDALAPELWVMPFYSGTGTGGSRQATPR